MQLTVRELCLKEVIVSASDLSNSLCKLRALFLVKVDERSLVLLSCEQDLEWPDTPVRHTGPESLVLEYGTDLLLRFQRSVVTEHVRAILLLAVLDHLLDLKCGLLGK